MEPNQSMDIQGMYDALSVECTFQKNMFPGLVYRRRGCPVVTLCFRSGKVVLTGGKTLGDIETGWRAVWDTVKSFIR